MSIGTPIRILHATCPADFGQREITIVGLTDEGAAKALRARLEATWNSMEPKDQEFWDHEFEQFYESWNINTTGGRLEP